MVTLITFASALAGNSILTCKSSNSSLLYQKLTYNESLPAYDVSCGWRNFHKEKAITHIHVFHREHLAPFYSHHQPNQPHQVSCSGAVIGSATNDWILRRTRFVYGSFSLAAALSLVAAMSSQVATATAQGHIPSKAISGVGIFSIFLFGWIFSFVYTPNQSLYCTEVLNQEIRAKGISLHALESNLATILFTYTTSIALEDISWKYYFVWISVDFVAGILWFFFGVETVGRTIEELDACFEAKFPPKASWKRTKIVRDENEELGVRVVDMGP